MAERDELAQLEAERARLLSMIAYQNRSMRRRSPWLKAAALGFLCGSVVFVVVAIASIQNSVSDLILFIGFVGLSGYIFTRKVTVFGITIPVIAIITLSPGGPSAGETETRRRLADCEARIAKLKEGHS
ncbi:hypothetical protein [Nitrobacter sp. JJSN]|uniref:hypothetical protein n=1 Tax=Nitrobacter sp. JJSN TaxID=3453033 RepID=UPI003F76C15A